MIDRKLYIMLLVLIGVLFANSLVHLFHPAYRFYRNHAADLDHRYSVFEKRVRDQFVPAIFQVATNSRVFASSNFVYSNLTDSVTYVPTTLTARYFISGGVGFMDYLGRVFSPGDDLFGYTIIDIRPTIVITDGRVFLISSSPSSSSPSSASVPKIDNKSLVPSLGGF